MRLSIRTKLAGAFALTVGMSLALGAVGAYNLTVASARLEELRSGPMQQNERLMTVRAYVSDIGRLLNTMDSVDNDGVFKDMEASVAERGKSTLDMLAEYRAAAPKTELPSVDSLKGAVETYLGMSRQVMDLLRTARADPAGQADAAANARSLMGGGMQPSMASMINQLKTQLGREKKRTDALAAQTDANSRLALMQMLALVAGAVVLGLVVATWLGLSISRGLKRSVDLARQIGSGDLTHTIRAKGSDEIAELQRAMGDMTTK
uniref:HAMP domain-containing protein n=1 Tax=Aureimonas sp. AU40 TaxID=1637747 RepID=UPI000A9E31E8